MSKQIEIKKGDRVAFSRQWLRSFAIYTGWRPFARGTVVAIEAQRAITFAIIAWDGNPLDRTDAVNVKNLVREDRIPLED